MIHLYWMTWNILNCKFFYETATSVFLVSGLKCTPLDAAVSKARHYNESGAGCGCVLCDSLWSLNHLLVALDFLHPSLTEIIVVFIAAQSQLL